jgi:hypothetical protein
VPLDVNPIEFIYIIPYHISHHIIYICDAVEVSVCSEIWFLGGFSDLIQVWEVVVSVVLIFHEALLRLLIEAFEGN